MSKPAYIKDLFLTKRFFYFGGIVTVFYLAAYFFKSFLPAGHSLFALLFCLVLIDYAILFFTSNEVRVKREIAERLSNGEKNDVSLLLSSTYKIPLRCKVIDELPFQLQQRDFLLSTTLLPKSNLNLAYQVQPIVRGEYSFGDIHVFIRTKLQLMSRRFTCNESQLVKVYPSFLQLKRFQIRALPEWQSDSVGFRPLRKGASTEFDHIKDYVRGDDARSINWKASARRNELMVNSFMDEKSQQIYCVIDKGRLMKIPFHQLSLLDHSVNAALMFCYVALQKNDKTGLIAFNEHVRDVVPAARTKKQFNAIIEALYNIETTFLESNFADLYAFINKKIGHRSLLLLFTNFETRIGFERQLPYLKAMSQKHLLCLVFFENEEVVKWAEQKTDSLEDIYLKTIADKFVYEKKMIVKELRKQGILTVFTTPKNLSIDVVNKYLELKARKMI